MKFFLLLGMVFLSVNSNGQLWKEYLDSAKIYQQEKNNNQAIQYFEKAKTELAKDSIVSRSYVNCCKSLAALLYGTGQYKKAEPVFLEAKKASEAIGGKEDRDYISVCINLGDLYRVLGDLKNAESNAMEAHLTSEKVYGKEHAIYAGTCNTLGSIYMVTRDYKKAEPLYMKAIQVRKKVLGEGPDYATSCNNLAILYTYKGDYEKAESLYVESRDVRKKALGPNHPDYAASCSNIGDLYINLGKFKLAESSLLESKQIRENVLGKKHPDYSFTCNNLARLYVEMGEYDLSEQYYLEARENLRKVFGENHPNYATTCNNLGILYKELGQYKKAEELYLEAKQIRENVYKKNHPVYAQSCNNLGGLYIAMELYEKAEAYYLETKQIRENVLGKEHPDYARICSNLADLYYSVNKYSKAEELYLEAYQLVNKLYGKEHPDLAQICGNLAVLYLEMGQLEKAEPIYIESRTISENLMGKDHPAYLTSCNNMAYYYWCKKDYKKAYDLYLESFNRRNDLLKKIFKFTSEQEQMQFMKKHNDYNEYVYSFIHSASDPSFYPEVYSFLIKSKEMSLSSVQQVRSSVYYSGDTAANQLFKKWLDNRQQLSFWRLKPSAERPEKLSQFEEEVNSQEKELTRISATFKNELEKKEVTWKNIQQSLNEKEASIEFSYFQYYDSKQWTDSVFYVALLLRKDKPAPELIYLFEKRQLDSTLNVKPDVNMSRVDKLYSTNNLYNLIWKPLESKLTGISTVYFSATGQLHLLNLSALPADNNMTIGEKYMLVQMNSTTSIANRSNENISPSDKILLYGGIKYSTDSISLIEASRKYSMQDYASRSLPSGFGGADPFEELFYSEVEVDSIHHYAKKNGFTTTVIRSVNANEESIKILSGKNSPVVLHLATHGFFNSDPIKIKKRESMSGGKVFAISDDPLMRSGLLMAGANNIWSGNPISGIEDGVLTGYEASNLYLPNTKLVVLSACETGLGDIQGSEGVYGLQRAFKMAGVQNLVMSLWSIPDNTTAEFMQLFYKYLFENKPIREAFSLSQSIMRNKYKLQPHKWAGLILVQ
jgi:CHAT domain-containing protein/Flp pilus assembly protein TadD